MTSLSLTDWNLPLFRHQSLAVDRWLADRELGLGMQPGLGKTRTALEAIKLLWEVPHWLVVAPKRVAGQVWPAEVRRWQQLDPGQVRILGSEDFNMGRPKAKPAGAPKDWQPGELMFLDLKATRAHLRNLVATFRVIVVTWDWVFWLAAALGDRPHFQGVVMDESYYVKTKGTKRFQAARRLCAGATYRLALNGTPLAQGWEDLWSQSYLLDQGRTFGRTLTDFRSMFLQPIVGHQGRIEKWADPTPVQRVALEQAFLKLWMPMRARDWIEMPDLMPPNDIFVDLPQEHWDTATALMRAAIAQLPNGAKMLPPSVAAGLNKALQYCQGRVYDEDRVVVRAHDCKLDALVELLQGIDGGALLFYQFQHDASAIREVLGDQVAHLDDAGAQERWESGSVKVLMAHPASMAVGLNLQGAGNNVVWFGGTWDGFLYHQGIARVHRLGQQAPSVFVHRILTRHPVERLQLDTLEKKITLLDAVMALRETT